MDERQGQLAGAAGGQAGAVVLREEAALGEFMSGGWEGEGVCNEPGGGRSGRGRLDVRARLKGEAMAGNGLGGV